MTWSRESLILASWALLLLSTESGTSPSLLALLKLVYICEAERLRESASCWMLLGRPCRLETRVRQVVWSCWVRERARAKVRDSIT